MDNENLNVVNDTQSEVVDTQTTEPVQPTESVNTEVAPVQQEQKPVQSAEENARYAEIRRRAETEALDKFIASQNLQFEDGRPIKTKAEYDEAVRFAEERQRQQALIDQGIDPSIINQYVENLPEVQWARQQREQQTQQERTQADFNMFLQTYPDVNPNDIPMEVWQQVQQGKSLVDAYAKHENALLKAEIEKFKKGQVTQQANKSTAATAIGSVTGQGAIPTDFISKETFEANKHDQNWMYKNYEQVRTSMNRWK